MKTNLYTLALLLALFAAGCSDHRSIARMDQLEKEVAALKTEREERNRKFNMRMEQFDRETARLASNATNVTVQSIQAIEAVIREEMQIEVAARFEVFARTNRAALAAAKPGVQPVRPVAMKKGVPSAVYDQIAAEAARRWPGDFTMQEFNIANQIEAWQKLQAAGVACALCAHNPAHSAGPTPHTSSVLPSDFPTVGNQSPHTHASLRSHDDGPLQTLRDSAVLSARFDRAFVLPFVMHPRDPLAALSPLSAAGRDGALRRPRP